MKKVKVLIKDKHLLELQEDALKGDLIDLTEVMEVDESFLNDLIEKGKDKVYEAKLKQVQDQYANQIESLKKDQTLALVSKEQEIEKKYLAKIQDLENESKILKATKASELEMIKSEKDAKLEKVQLENQAKYQKLEQEFNHLKEQMNVQLQNKQYEVENVYKDKIASLEQKIQNYEKDQEILKLEFENEKEKALSFQKEELNQQIKEKEDMINQLQRAKATLNVKQTGEDLESWCNNEVFGYMQNGLFNCTWIKDNKVIKDEDEIKGSKADYIFNIYASEEHKDDELLASICMDMKDENPDSVNKKSNADYYKQLDKNRMKKNCKYALLVSNLEMDKPNVLPIFKVREYNDMYVVRPAYLMVFLNILASLTTRFASLLLSQEVEMLELKEKEALIEEFNAIKNTYLDKPLDTLAKDIEEIRKSSKSIRDASQKIDEQCDKINLKYIKIIEDKISRFELSLGKIQKKL